MGKARPLGPRPRKDGLDDQEELDLYVSDRPWAVSRRGFDDPQLEGAPAFNGTSF